MKGFSLSRLVRTTFVAGALLMSASAWADRNIVDQLGRSVTIPDIVNRVVVLQHQTLNILVQLDAQKRVVGVLDTWKKDLGEGFVQLMPTVDTLPTPGGLTSVNIEALAKLKPEVVFVTNYAPKEMIDQITRAGFPVVAISLRDDKKNQNALNPTMKSSQENAIYTEGLFHGIRLIGEVVGEEKNANDLIAWVQKDRAIVKEHLKDIKPEHRVRAYMANPDLVTYGSGKYTGVMFDQAGAVNVAAQSLKGYKQVSMEQVIQWNPEVIFVQNRFPQVIDEIKKNPAWKVIDAVKNNRIYLMPQYAKAWGYPQPEAMALGELWLAQKLYPEQFKDVDLSERVNAYYQRFYRTNYAPTK